MENHNSNLALVSRNPALDIVRGLAAFMVLIHHARNIFFKDYQPGIGVLGKFFYFVTNFGPDAVMVFFILSGYLVGGSVMRQMKVDKWSWRKYLITRVSRLWVVLLPALLITAALDHTGLAFFHTAFYDGNEGNWLIRTPVVEALTPLTFVCNVFFLQTLECHTFGSNGPLWSLANEFWYYLWFPPIIAIFYHRNRNRLIDWLSFALVLVTMVLFPSIIIGFVLWLLGAAGAALQKQDHRRFREMTKKAEWPALVFFFGILFASRLIHMAAEVVGLAFFIYFLCLLTRDTPSTDGALSRLGFLIAEQSYTLYLVHMPFILLVVSATVGARSSFGSLKMLWYCGLIVLTYAFASIIYFLFERNTVRVKNFLLEITRRST